MAHGPRKKRLDFGNNLVLELDPGIFEAILPLLYCKRPSGLGLTNRPNTTHMNKLKSDLAEICAPRAVLF